MGGPAASWWRSAARWAGRSASASPAGDDDLPAGRQIGNFRVERLIARGASGSVYIGIDTLHGTPVALKTVELPHEDDPGGIEARDRFLREAHAAMRLQHPDIVRVHGAGCHGQTLGFIVMELLAGSDLTRYTRPARLLPEPVVLRVAARVADALAYAHGAGVVHRDVKPANIMVHLPSHEVKLTDFGTARLDDASRTRTGYTLGTPTYMAPEQLAGGSVDGRSDLYSLGVVLFQLLCGRLPYEGASLGELLRAIAGSAPLDLLALRPDLPADLAALVSGTLAKHPADRPADGNRLAAELRRIEARLAAETSFTAHPRPAP